MQISARNKLKGRITGIETGSVNSVVKIELTGSPMITAVITNEAVKELELAVDGRACAVIKASSVLVGACDHEECGCE